MFVGSPPITDALPKSSFQGTRDLDSLPCQPLTPEMEAELIARGRLYTALSGIHYRSSISVPWPKRCQIFPRKICGSFLVAFMASISPQRFYVTEIEPVSFDHNAWDHLVLDPETRVLIKSLVQVTRNSRVKKLGGANFT
ncbi:hypothetical protein K438DRAFT_1776474 [Mycena galopus ATCC 62051]|nr:hypothetical protein K438DRAFT_1784548 [Mycena galopus ATCC 62051]KAF8160490.1 hypothetical protein K438DRAFT_1776474 [Mycena galopus ATCC 62051]